MLLDSLSKNVWLQRKRTKYEEKRLIGRKRIDQEEKD